MKKLDPDGIHNWIGNLVNPQKNKFIFCGVDDDDCAIINLGKIKIVITTDFLNSNPIVKELGISSNWNLGRLLVAANLSDLCGTGAKPIAMLTSLMFKKGTLEKEFKEFIKGIKFELDKYKIPLIGGDTKLGVTDTFCGIAVGIGSEKCRLFPKNNAKPGDEIWLSGEVGSVSAAVLGLTSGEMSSSWEKWAKNVLLEPKLPLKKSLRVSNLNIGNGGTDISDGLGKNIYDLCESSNVGAVIFADQIPVNSRCSQLSSKIEIPLWSFAFNIGGDFQFIVTGLKRHKNKFKQLGFYQIGEITKSNKKILVTSATKKIPLPKTGHTDLNIKSFSNEVATFIHSTQKLIR